LHAIIKPGISWPSFLAVALEVIALPIEIADPSWKNNNQYFEDKVTPMEL